MVGKKFFLYPKISFFMPVNHVKEYLISIHTGVVFSHFFAIAANYWHYSNFGNYCPGKCPPICTDEEVFCVGANPQQWPQGRGCSASDITDIDSVTNTMNATTSTTHVSCFGLQDGSVTLNVINGGVSPFQYSSNNGVNYKYNKLAGKWEALRPGEKKWEVIELSDLKKEIGVGMSTPIQLPG